MAKGQIFTEEEKRAIVNETKSSTTNEVASSHGLHPITITKWKRQLKNKRGKRRMTKPKPKTIISNGEVIEVTELKRKITELSADLQFWQQQYLKLVKESQ